MGLLNKSEKIFKVCSYLLVIAFALVTLYPIVYAFSVSISGKLAYESGLITLLPKDITLQAYEMVIESKGFWIAYANTLFYTVIGTAWSMGISLTGAYALQKKKLKFRRQWNFLLVFTMWFSAGMIPLYLNYKSMHVDNRWGMVVAFGVQAYNIILLRNYFSSIPKELEEAAIVDGANEFQLFYKIYVPMSTASIATVTLFGTGTTGPGCFSPTPTSSRCRCICGSSSKTTRSCTMNRRWFCPTRQTAWRMPSSSAPSFRFWLSILTSRSILQKA